MDNTERLLRAFIKAAGYEITELDAKPCEKQCEGMPVIFDGGDYKLTPTINFRTCEIGGTLPIGGLGESNF